MLEDKHVKKRSKDTELTLLRKTVVTFFFLVFVFEAGGETPLDWQWNEPEVLKVCTAGMIRALALTLSDPLYGTDTARRNTSDAASSHVVLAAEAHSQPCQNVNTTGNSPQAKVGGESVNKSSSSSALFCLNL